MDVIDAIHARRSIRVFLPRPVERRHIEEVVWDAAQAPPTFSGQMPWTFNVVEGVERISAFGDEALEYARKNHPDEPGWEWTDRPRLSGLLGCSGCGHHIRPSRRLLPRRPELDVVRPCQRSGHLLGGITDVVGENSLRKG